MKNHTKDVDNEILFKKVDELTEESRRCFLGVLEALSFAQSLQKQAGKDQSDKRANFCKDIG
jgi:hypothetical protein